MPHFTGNPSYSIPAYSSSGARKGTESSAVGTIALTVFPAVSISRFRLPGSVAEGDCQTRSALEGLTLHAAAARHARMRRSPNLQCQSGRPALGSSRSRLRTPASARHSAQSSTGRDSWSQYRVKWPVRRLAGVVARFGCRVGEPRGHRRVGERARSWPWCAFGARSVCGRRTAVRSGGFEASECGHVEDVPESPW